MNFRFAMIVPPPMSKLPWSQLDTDCVSLASIIQFPEGRSGAESKRLSPCRLGAVFYSDPRMKQGVDGTAQCSHVCPGSLDDL